MRASDQRRLCICAHIADRDVIRHVDPNVLLIATEQAADLYESDQSVVDLLNLLHVRSREAIQLLDRYLFVIPPCPEDESALFAGFFEHIASEYEHLIDPSCNLHNISVLISLLTMIIGDLRGLSILDFGCGTGLSLGPLEAAEASLIGMDRSMGMRKVAEARGMHVISLEELVAWPGTFDGVISSYVFHLCLDRRSVEVICSKLRSGGAVVGNCHKDLGITLVTQLFHQFGCEPLSPTGFVDNSRHGRYLAFIKG
jgi:SAM-dependent methyltransferase